MKTVLLVFFISISVFAIKFNDAASLVKAYKEYGFTIKGDIKLDMFRRLSGFYDEIQKNLTKTTGQRAVLSFIDPELKTNIFVQGGVINIQIPEVSDAEIVFNQFMRINKIHTFLMQNSIKSVFNESNLHFFEKFIKIYKGNGDFTGTSISEVKFDNILYPMANIGSNSRIQILLPHGKSYLYWENTISKVSDSDFDKGLKDLAKAISKKSQIDFNTLYKNLIYNKTLFSDSMKEKTDIAKAKFRNTLIRLLARDFPPKILPGAVVKSIENIPYRKTYRKKKAKELLAILNTTGLKDIKTLDVSFLTPLRVSTVRKIVEVLNTHRDLVNVNVDSVVFDNRNQKPTIKMNEKTKRYTLVLSDYATRNNVYATLKQIPLK